MFSRVKNIFGGAARGEYEEQDGFLEESGGAQSEDEEGSDSDVFGTPPESREEMMSGSRSPEDSASDGEGEPGYAGKERADILMDAGVQMNQCLHPQEDSVVLTLPEQLKGERQWSMAYTSRLFQLYMTSNEPPFLVERGEIHEEVEGCLHHGLRSIHEVPVDFEDQEGEEGGEGEHQRLSKKQDQQRAKLRQEAVRKTLYVLYDTFTDEQCTGANAVVAAGMEYNSARVLFWLPSSGSKITGHVSLLLRDGSGNFHYISLTHEKDSSCYEWKKRCCCLSARMHADYSADRAALSKAPREADCIVQINDLEVDKMLAFFDPGNGAKVGELKWRMFGDCCCCWVTKFQSCASLCHNMLIAGGLYDGKNKMRIKHKPLRDFIWRLAKGGTLTYAFLFTAFHFADQWWLHDEFRTGQEIKLTTALWGFTGLASCLVGGGHSLISRLCSGQEELIMPGALKELLIQAALDPGVKDISIVQLRDLVSRTCAVIEHAPDGQEVEVQRSYGAAGVRVQMKPAYQMV